MGTIKIYRFKGAVFVKSDHTVTAAVFIFFNLDAGW